MLAVVFLGVLVAAVLYKVMTADERARARQQLVILIRRLRAERRRDLEPVWRALRERTPAAFVTPALAAVHVVVFAGLVFGAGAVSDAATLQRWGAGIGPQTTNGEWWRLVSAAWVHGGFLALAIDTAALIQLGFLLERLLGAFPFAAAYGSAAMLAAVVQLWESPLAPSMGASGAVFGLYGLLLAELAKGRIREYVTIPVVAAKWLAPVTVVFVLFNVVDQSLSIRAELAGLLAGLLFGYAVVGDVQLRTPSPRRVGIGLAAALTMTIVMAVPLRGMVDIRPEIQRLVDLERQTADAYAASLGAARKQGGDIGVAVRAIEVTIVPALREAGERLNALRGVPPEDRWRVTAALDYVRLRSESWELRMHGLRDTSARARVSAAAAAVPGARPSAQAAAEYRATLLALGRAEAAERAALQTLDRIKT